MKAWCVDTVNEKMEAQDIQDLLDLAVSGGATAFVGVKGTCSGDIKYRHMIDAEYRYVGVGYNKETFMDEETSDVFDVVLTLQEAKKYLYRLKKSTVDISSLTEPQQEAIQLIIKSFKGEC